MKIGEKAIDFRLIGTDDHSHSLTDYSNEYLAVIFCCNHCPVCPYVIDWEDRMVRIQADYAGKGLQLIALNVNDASELPDDAFQDMKNRARENRFNFPYLRDDDQQVAKTYGAKRTPEVFLFDANRVLRYHGAIDDNYRDPNAVKINYLRNALDALLEAADIQTPDTAPVGCYIRWK